MSEKKKKRWLMLKDGTCLEGLTFGSDLETYGEVVFNTGMIGYPEALTDPSYEGQILCFTYPLIGNYGVPGEDLEDKLLKYFESDRICVKGIIVSDCSNYYSHWNAKRSLSQWLDNNNIPGICDIDTRLLTKLLREKGTMLGKIACVKGDLKSFDDIGTSHMVKKVSVRSPVEYGKGKKRIVLIDCGVKNSIIRAFLKRNFKVIRVPWNYDFTKIEASGYILSNGPGDPRDCDITIKYVKKALKKKTPILGICLGSQILALAAGALTYKLKYGHRGHNQPCSESGNKRCYITSQNHGYAVESETLPLDWREWFTNNNDGTNEGIIHVSRPFFGTQFHPEASPGPDDTEFIFDLFLRAMRT